MLTKVRTTYCPSSLWRPDGGRRFECSKLLIYRLDVVLSAEIAGRQRSRWRTRSRAYKLLFMNWEARSMNSYLEVYIRDARSSPNSAVSTGTCNWTQRVSLFLGQVGCW